MADARSELEALCSHPVSRDADSLKLGEILWLSGRAVPAQTGTIGLHLDGLTVIVRKEDVRKVERIGNLFRIGIGANANATFRIERTTRLGDLLPIRSDCACCAESEGGAARKSRRPGLVSGDTTVCKIRKPCIRILGKDYCIDLPYDCE